MRGWLLMGLVGLTLVGCNSEPEKVVEGPKSPEVSQKIDEPVDGIDRLKISEEMRVAIHEARETLPEFWAAWEKNGFGEGDYIVNAQFMNADSTEGEFLWMSVEARGEGEVTGLLEGQPTISLDVKSGDRVTVKEADVVDWMFVPEDGDHKGGYTLKALGTSAE